ncbi:MAG TPA: hypothetical protein VFO55_04230 [Gemmatimonadaceae bacterium]|nr:hypothetical protein [Gemmatimonadaceae bacterium]
MESIHGAGEQGELLEVVRGVRSRWRLKHALRGSAIALAGAFVVYAITALVVHSLNYSEASVLAGRAVCIVALIALAIRFVVMPILPKLRDERVALYLEEHEPSVDGAIFTSVEVDRAIRDGDDRISPALARRLSASAIERARTVGAGRRVDAAGVRNGWLMIAAVAVVAALITTVGPAPLRNGLRLLATPWKPAEASTIFSIAVEPGNMTIAKGGDAEVMAQLRNFQSDEVKVMARAADSSSWIEVPMTADSTGKYTARLLDIGVPTEYLVEANGIRSATYRIEVTNLPYVKNMNMEYRYPGYTGLPAEKFDSTGDIAALKGTLVTLEVETTMPTQGGQVVLDNGEKIRLTPGTDGTLTATLRVDHTGFYRVELAGPDGAMVTGSLDYTIDMLLDRKPTVTFRKPGRDSRVMAVDEVYTEAEAKDDYGVSRLELVYSVNGQPERTVPLSQATSRVLKDISAGYTFMLEDYQLSPGDVVSYFARAVDNDAVSGAKAATTDIYFLNVAPYQRDYRQGQQQQGGGGGQPPENPGQFSQRQRDIIAATFKSGRDSADVPAKTLSEDVQTIRLSQQKLREEVEGLGRRLVERGITAQDSNYAKIAKLMTKAGAMMDTVERTLGATRLTDARGPEQRALQQLMQAEAVFKDITVQQQQGGGGGGGGGESEAQDLADLFELRQERMRNQYEEVNRGQNEQQEQQQRQIDSVAQKLKELAQRQQSEDERARAKRDSMGGNRQQQSGGGGGGGARQSAQQAEDAARMLERLARERQSETLAEAARALQNAADEMRRSGASGQQGMSPQAQRQLEEARRLMDQERRQGEQKNVNDALDKARQLKAEQQRVNNDVNRLNTADSAAARREIAQRSGQMADEVRELTQQMDRIARNVQSEQPAAARALRNAADSVRAARLESQIRAAQQMAGGNTPSNYLRDVAEPQISRGIDNLNRQLEQAQQAANSAQNQQAGEQSLDKVRDVVSGVESLAERVQQQVDQANARRLTGQGQEQGQEQGQGQRQGQRQGQGQGEQGQRGEEQGQRGQGQGQAQGRGEGQRQGQGQGQGQEQSQAQQGRGQGQGRGEGQGQGRGQEQSQGQQGRGEGQGQGQGQGQQQSQNQSQQGGQAQGRPGREQGGNGGPGGNGNNFDPQFQRELAQRLAEAEALRRELSRQGRDVSQLDQAIEGLQRARNLRSLSDERAARMLQSQVDALKTFEFQLARAITGEKEGVRVGRVGDVPPAYRAWVDEYYREIGKTPAKKPPL